MEIPIFPPADAVPPEVSSELDVPASDVPASELDVPASELVSVEPLPHPVIKAVVIVAARTKLSNFLFMSNSSLKNKYFIVTFPSCAFSHTLSVLCKQTKTVV
jgi:hypothetical protein